MANSTTNSPGNHHHTGLVIKKNNGIYTVRAGIQLITCSLSAQFRVRTPGHTGNGKNDKQKRPGKEQPDRDQRMRADPLAVGDQVEISPLPGNHATITSILPRRNWLSRPSAVPMPSARPFEQVIAANVDQVMPVFAAADPPPKWNLLDRYLVAAEAADIPALICLTKLDLVGGIDQSEDSELSEMIAIYCKVGYPVIQVSALTGEGLPEIEAALKGRVSVLVGKSGVGKSTLLNALQPGLGLRVNAVSQVTGKGMHTTTHMEMFELECGASIIDTPGVRAFGLWDVGPDELDAYFPEMAPYLGRCRYRLDCAHHDEPGCAVREAVMAGAIDPRRWKSYLTLRDDP
jgi:ribosome biogenesis GTPase / thiamine phosphate phosphatase